MTIVPPVSIHGGHSGQFCSHARDSLDGIVNAYIEKGFPWVGITEHMPPLSDQFAYPEERNAGLDAKAQYERFGDYIRTCRQLQARHKDRIRIHVGFETETYSGSLAWINRLRETFAPDYIVGSLHHVDDIPFDLDPAAYEKATAHAGSVDNLYIRYFDLQYEMIRTVEPLVIGHLDVIRIYDPDYRSRLVKPAIWKRILRNLKLIRQLGSILDFNLRPLSKGRDAPYLDTPILKTAVDLGIHIVPGDDSHGIADIGRHMDTAIDHLRAAGAPFHWREPLRP